jgi:carbonic anhydrase
MDAGLSGGMTREKGKPMETQTKETLDAITTQKALSMLKEGNRRFVEGHPAKRDLRAQVTETSTGQFPFAVVLGCIDSRVPPELVFDLGIGDIFSIRIAGNLVNEDVLGSMEFACKVVGSKYILVLGHTSCGAVQGAYDDVELGHLTELVAKIKPAVKAVMDSSGSEADLDHIAEMHVRMTVGQIKKQSPILKEMLDKGEIGISGAMHDVATGRVSFI